MKTSKLLSVAVASFALGAITMAIINKLYLTEPATSRICSSYDRDDIARISLHELMEDAARYRTTHAQLAEDTMRQLSLQNKIASRSCYFTLETLKKFLYYVETYSKSHEIQSKQIAINFYYTVYPREKVMPNGKQYGSLHSLYLVPSKLDSESRGYDDFDPISNKTLTQLVNYREKPNQGSGINGIIDRLKQTQIFALAPQPVFQLMSSPQAGASDTAPLMRNQGGLCPCPPKNVFEDIDALYPSVAF
jgi:hypothetical protein